MAAFVVGEFAMKIMHTTLQARRTINCPVNESPEDAPSAPRRARNQKVLGETP